MKDKIYTYSANCTWHGSIKEVGFIHHKITYNNRPIESDLPCCPFCKSPLYQYDSIEEWNKKVKEFAEKINEPLYVKWIETLRGPCKPLRGWNWRKELAEFKAKIN